MHCPTRDETLAALLALLPRGRAWQSNLGGPEPYRDAAFSAGSFDPAAYDAKPTSGSVMYRFWSAVAGVIDFAHQRLCALALEMFCATANETRDQWMIEYGLPDPCDAYPDLCTKVAATGGTRCEYFAVIASRAGWAIWCDDGSEWCGDQIGDFFAGAGMIGNALAAVLTITVDTHASPSFTGSVQTPPQPGLLMAGLPLACDPDISSLQCLLERIVPAHVSLVYLTI